MLVSSHRIFVSVIIPNFNHFQFLTQRIESVLNQTFQNFEIILLDDSSTDESIEILRKYALHPKVSQLMINKHNSGSPFKQWQKGIKYAKGNFIWIAESDDFCDKTFLEKTLGFLKSNSQVGLVYTQSIDVDENNNFKLNRIEWTKNFQPNIWTENFNLGGKEFLKKYLKVKNVIPNASAVVFRKSIVEDTVLWEKICTMKMCGDWYFWAAIAAHKDIGFLKENLNYFRTHKDISRNNLSRENRILRLLEEAEVRRFINHHSADQKVEIYRLYKKWFQLFQLQDLGTKYFYQIVVKNSHYFPFILNFIKFKFNVYRKT